MVFAAIFSLIYYSGLIIILALAGLVALLIYQKRRISSLRELQNQQSNGQNKIRLAFFHPKCNAGGGGEKVLWCMIESLMKKYKQNEMEIVIYTGGQAPDEAILKKAEDRFQTKLPYSPKFVRLDRDRIIDPDLYPVFTMLGQIIGTMVLTANALGKYAPDYFIDTTGLAFGYWLVKLLAPFAKVGAYVHYPFISHEMLNNIINKKQRYNNNARIADSPFLSNMKIYYYKTLVFLYEKMGNQVDFAWANSSWTANHIKEVWPKWGNKATNQVKTLFPPCSVKSFSSLSDNKRKNVLLSFAQYRPEKNHRLQLEVFKTVLDKNPGNDIQFYIVGSCRGAEDDQLLNGLREYATQLGLKDRVQFFVNLPFNSLLEQFEKASIAIHTMEAEHFGIAIVEMMAAGLAVIAHNSAGPKLDIIRERKESPVGFLASSKEEYIQHLDYCVKNINTQEFKELTKRAKKDADRFSDEKFQELFLKDMKEVLGK